VPKLSNLANKDSGPRRPLKALMASRQGSRGTQAPRASSDRSNFMIWSLIVREINENEPVRLLDSHAATTWAIRDGEYRSRPEQGSGSWRALS